MHISLPERSHAMTDTMNDAPGRRTSISKDPIGVDPIGNDPHDFSGAPPKKSEGPNRSVLGWTATATTFFMAAVVLGVIMLIAIVVFAMQS
jgi:hypothetical protein